MLLRQGHYRNIETSIVGKQALSKAFRRSFDVVTCASLGITHLPARCFEDMLSALRPGGYLAFAVGTKHLGGDDPLNLHYAKTIKKLEAQGRLRQIVSEKFLKYHGVHKEQFSFLVF